MPRPKMKKTGPSIDDETPLWEFIYENVCKRKDFEEVDIPLFERYLADHESPWTAQELFDFYTKTMEPALYKATLDIETILALYKQLEIEIEPHVEKMLEIRSGAGLRIDGDRCLIHYQFYNQSNKRKPTPEAPKEVIAEVEEKNEEPVEPEEPIRKKVKPWPSPVKRVSKGPPRNLRGEGGSIVEEVTPVKNNSLIKKVLSKTAHPKPITDMTPHVPIPVPLATSTPLNTSCRMPIDVEISDEFNESIWNHVRENFDTLTSQKIMSAEFWAEMLETREMGIKSPYIVLRHFHANLLKKLWKQKLEPVRKMRLIKELLLPMNRAQRKWLLENEGIDVELTDDGYVKSYEVPNEDDETMLEKPAPKPQPPKNINTWVARARPELPPSDDTGITERERSQSRQHSATSRTQSVASHSYSMNGFTPKNEDDLTMEKRRDKRVPFTYQDDVLAWKYILNQMYDPKTRAIKQEPVLPKGRSFWDQFIRKFNSPKTSSNWCSHYRKKMVGILHTMPFSRDTMLPLYTSLDIPITPDIHYSLEIKFSCVIKLGSDNVIKSYRWNTGNAREATIDTEPLVNDDEETDGESINAVPIAIESDDPSAIADEITKLSTASTTSLSSTPKMGQPSTSAHHDAMPRKRKKSNEDGHQIKKRSQKRFEVEEFDEEPAVAVPAVKTVVPVVPASKNIPVTAEKPKKNTTNVSRKTEESIELMDPDEELEAESEEPEEILVAPIELKEYDGNFMVTHDLLAAIKGVMSAGQKNENLDVVNEGAARAFKKRAENMPNTETLARYDITKSIDKTRGHVRRILNNHREELVQKTADFCENQDVFRKRLIATTINLDDCLETMNPPEPPALLEH